MGLRIAPAFAHHFLFAAVLHEAHTLFTGIIKYIVHKDDTILVLRTDNAKDTVQKFLKLLESYDLKFNANKSLLELCKEFTYCGCKYNLLTNSVSFPEETTPLL